MDRDHQERLPDRPHGEHLTTFCRDGVPQPAQPQDMARDRPRPIYRRMLQLGRPSPYTLPVKVIQRVRRPVPETPQNCIAPVPVPPQGPEPVPAPPQEILLCEDISENLESKPIPVYGPQGLDLPVFQYQPTIVGERGSKYAADNYLTCSCKPSCKSGEIGEACDCMLYSTLPYSNIDGEYRLLYCRDAIFECSDFCVCEDTCPMRTSRRFRGDLQLFYTGAAKGWGVRSSTPYLQVCQYASSLASYGKSKRKWMMKEQIIMQWTFIVYVLFWRVRHLFQERSLCFTKERETQHLRLNIPLTQEVMGTLDVSSIIAATQIYFHSALSIGQRICV